MFALALSAAALGLPLGPVELPADVTEVAGPRFEFPFRWATLAADPRGAVRVRLHVSRDEGRTWAAEPAEAADARSLSYDAPGDGVYWFAVQVEFRGGVRVPEARADLVTEMKVFVNTARRPVLPAVTTADVRRELSYLRSEVRELRERVKALEAGRKP